MAAVVLQHCPDFLSDDEEEDERKFTGFCRTKCCIGFVHERGIQHICLQVPERPAISEAEWKALGWDQHVSQVDAHPQILQALDFLEPVREQMTAYLGWLTTNPVFISERDALRDRWGSVIDALGQIPDYPVDLCSDGAGSRPRGTKEITQDFAHDLRAFYDRWHLLGFATWDLPKPRGGNLGGPPALSRLAGVADQPAIQVSPIISLGGRYPLSTLYRSVAAPAIPAHLAEWSAVQNQQQSDDLRFRRFAQIFQLGFYRDIVLASRYGDRFRGQIEPLDRAFGNFLGSLGSDAVKRLRMTISRRLGAA